MTGIITPGASILYMKVGTHARESLEEIIARKKQEIDAAGFALWGYGGNTCHPRTMVQPFAKEAEQARQPIYLCMEPMQSNHFATPARAKYYSADGVQWENVPEDINVLGSRFALKIKDLHEEHFSLPLHSTRVAVGPNQGRAGDRYIRGQVDKACLRVATSSELRNAPEQETTKDIGLVAELCPPYAVFLKGEDD